MTDYISNLPDSVLVIILGLLATHEAVRTCVLSKRWNNLWTSLAVLNINARDSQAQSSMTGINDLLKKITDIYTLEFHLKCALRLYCDATLPFEDRLIHLIATIPGRVQASPRTNLEMIEVKYWRFDSMVWRVMQHLMLGTGELKNFSNYHVTNGYYDHPYKTLTEERIVIVREIGELYSSNVQDSTLYMSRRACCYTRKLDMFRI